jgi:hypothetical protein
LGATLPTGLRGPSLDRQARCPVRSLDWLKKLFENKWLHEDQLTIDVSVLSGCKRTESTF